MRRVWVLGPLSYRVSALSHPAVFLCRARNATLVATYRNKNNKRSAGKVLRPDLSSPEAFRNDIEAMHRRGDLWPQDSDALYRALEVMN